MGQGPPVLSTTIRAAKKGITDPSPKRLENSASVKTIAKPFLGSKTMMLSNRSNRNLGLRCGNAAWDDDPWLK